MKETITTFLKFICFLLIAYQFISWFAMSKIYEGKESPMSEIEGFVVDNEGNVIIGDGFYQIIQIYNKDGKYLRKWRPETYGGSFKLFLGDNNTLIIKAARNDKKLTYNLNGQLVENTNISKNDLVNKIGYKITGGMFFPKIVYKNGESESTVVKQSILMNLLKAPLPFFGLGFLLLFAFGLKETIAKLNTSKENS